MVSLDPGSFMADLRTLRIHCHTKRGPMILKTYYTQPLKIGGWETTFLVGCHFFRRYVR